LRRDPPRLRAGDRRRRGATGDAAEADRALLRRLSDPLDPSRALGLGLLPALVELVHRTLRALVAALGPPRLLRRRPGPRVGQLLLDLVQLRLRPLDLLGQAAGAPRRLLRRLGRAVALPPRPGRRLLGGDRGRLSFVALALV